MAPSRKVQLGASAGATLIAAAAIFLLLNYLSARHFRRWDWTATSIYSISDKTKQVLDDAGAKGKTVAVTSLVAPADPLYESVRTLLDSYAAHSTHLTVDYLDPAAEPVKTQALLKQHNIQSETQLRTVFFESEGRSKQVDISEVVEYDYEGAEEGLPPRVKAFKGEQAFTGAILSVTQDTQSAICFLKGHQAATEQPADHSASKLAEVLKTQNYRIEDWDALGLQPIPSDCSVLVIAGPREMMVEQEVGQIQSYLRGGGRLLAMLDPVFTPQTTVAPTGLEQMLQEYGVTVGTDLVLDQRPAGVILLGAGLETLVLRDMPPHAVTKALSGGAAVMMPITRSVSPAATAPAGYEVTSILKTSADGWGETDLHSILANDVAPDPTDLKGPVSVGVAVRAKAPAAPAADADGTAAAASAAPAGGSGTRMVVMGDSDFASDSDLERLSNIDLALNSIQWLADREALIGIEPRQPEQVVLTLDPGQAALLKWLVLLGLPGLSALCGLGVWLARRS